MNSVSLIGRLTRDPDVRYSSSSQLAIARFSLAVDRIPDKSGEKKADFINIVCFGKTAEFVEKYVGKGRLVAVQGRIQNDNYQDQNGKTVYRDQVVCDRLEPLDRGDRPAQGQNQGGGFGSGDGFGGSQDAAPRSGNDDDDLGVFTKLTDDDIPF